MRALLTALLLITACGPGANESVMQAFDDPTATVHLESQSWFGLPPQGWSHHLVRPFGNGWVAVDTYADGTGLVSIGNMHCLVGGAVEYEWHGNRFVADATSSNPAAQVHLEMIETMQGVWLGFIAVPLANRDCGGMSIDFAVEVE